MERKAMRGSKISENEEQNLQVPPLSVGRIAGELFAGMALGFVASLAAACVIGTTESRGGWYAFFGFLDTLGTVFPPLYIVGSVVGVYLVGRIGKQTGSFLITLGCGILGGLCTVPVLRLAYFLPGNWLVRMLFLVFVLLLAPTAATIGFNSTRRYTDTFDILGTVVYKNSEGGFFAIDGDDGSKYDPISLPESFRKEGLQVTVTARLRKHVGSIHLYGPIIEVVNIARQGRQKGPDCNV